jgi:hypothetical protein
VPGCRAIFGRLVTRRRGLVFVAFALDFRPALLRPVLFRDVLRDALDFVVLGVDAFALDDVLDGFDFRDDDGLLGVWAFLVVFLRDEDLRDDVVFDVVVRLFFFSSVVDWRLDVERPLPAVRFFAIQQSPFVCYVTAFILAQ